MPTHGGSNTLPALLGAYLEDLHVRRYAAASSVRARHVLPRLFSHLRRQGVRDPRRVTESHLVSFARALKEPGANGRPLAAWSRSAYLAAVRSFFAFLEKHGLLLRNPALELHLPKARRLPRARLSEGQVRRLLAAPFPGSPIGLRDRAILEVLYGTGIRVSECARLDVGDVDLYEGTLLVRNGKGKKDRRVPLVGRAAAALDLYLMDGRPALLRGSREPALFLSWRSGPRLKAQGIQILVRKHARAAAAPTSVSAHSLRHACATHLLQGGADVREVQALLGHRCLETTALYTRVEVSDLRGMLERSHPRERRRIRRRR